MEVGTSTWAHYFCTHSIGRSVQGAVGWKRTPERLALQGRSGSHSGGFISAAFTESSIFYYSCSIGTGSLGNTLVEWGLVYLAFLITSSYSPLKNTLSCGTLLPSDPLVFLGGVASSVKRSTMCLNSGSHGWTVSFCLCFRVHILFCTVYYGHSILSGCQRRGFWISCFLFASHIYPPCVGVGSGNQTQVVRHSRKAGSVSSVLSKRLIVLTFSVGSWSKYGVECSQKVKTHNWIANQQKMEVLFKLPWI